MLHGNLLKSCVIATLVASGVSIALGQTAATDQKITVANFGGSLQQALRDGWADPFEKGTGIKVVFDAPHSKAKLKAMVDARNPSWDLYVEDAAYILAHCGVLFEKVDTSKFVAAGIDKRFISNDCGMSSGIVGYVFAYDEEKFRNDPPKTWADFFDLKKYPGKRAMHNVPVNGSLEMALLADGVPPDKLFPLDVDRAFRKLDTIKPQILWTASSGGLTDALVNDQVDIALSYSGRAFAAAKAGAKVAIVRDQQIVSWDQYAIVKGSKNKAAAEKFLQFVALPEQQATFTELRGYLTGNTKAKPRVDALVVKFLPSLDTAIPQNHEWWAKNLDSVSQRYIAWQSK